MHIHVPVRRTVAVTAAMLLVAGGCSDRAEPGADSTTPPGPVLSPTATAPATPSATPAASPAASPAGPAPEADGCPPAHEDRATTLPLADAVPTTATRQVTEAPSGREIDVTLVTVSTADAVGEQITTALEQHVEQLIEAWDETAGPPPGDDDEEEEGTPQPELEVRLTPGRVDRTVVSVVMEGFEYLGGASGNGITDGWVFATATGDEVELADVGLDGPCLDELGTLAADALAAEDVGMFEEAEAALRAGKVSMDRWSLHDDALHVHFPAYELAPGAAGPLTAELDLAAVNAATGTPLGSER